jgi:hypothetical protein
MFVPLSEIDDGHVNAHNSFIGRPVLGSEATAARIQNLMRRDKTQKPVTDHMGRLVVLYTRRRAALTSPAVIEAFNHALDPTSAEFSEGPAAAEISVSAYPKIIKDNGLHKVFFIFEGEYDSTPAWEVNFISGRLRSAPNPIDNIREILFPPITGSSVVDTPCKHEAGAVARVLRHDFPHNSLRLLPAQVISIPVKS